MTAEVDWSDAASVIEYLVASVRVLAGPKRPFDEREIVLKYVNGER